MAHFQGSSVSTILAPAMLSVPAGTLLARSSTIAPSSPGAVFRIVLFRASNSRFSRLSRSVSYGWSRGSIAREDEFDLEPARPGHRRKPLGLLANRCRPSLRSFDLTAHL